MSKFQVYSISNSVFEQNTLTQSITLDIILDRNNVIIKRWHYAETYKTDKSIFEYEKNGDVTFDRSTELVPIQRRFINREVNK